MGTATPIPLTPALSRREREESPMGAATLTPLTTPLSRREREERPLDATTPALLTPDLSRRASKRYTSPHRFRKYHSTVSRVTSKRKYGQVSQNVFLVSC